MRILLFSDAHSNQTALEAVLAHARDHGGWDDAWYLGDIVGVGPYPEKVAETVRKVAEDDRIRGNWDRYFAHKDWHNPVAGTGASEKKLWIFDDAKWCYDHMSEDAREIVSETHESLQKKISNLQITLVHGAPDSDETGLFPDDSEKELIDKIGNLEADILVCGHTHMPMDRTVSIGGRAHRIINPGSVGLPLDGDQRASYAILEFDDDGQVFCDHRRVEYDVDSVIEELHEQETLGRIAGRSILGLGSAESF